VLGEIGITHSAEEPMARDDAHLVIQIGPRNVSTAIAEAHKFKRKIGAVTRGLSSHCQSSPHASRGSA
jgi:hypothetical protein